MKEEVGHLEEKRSFPDQVSYSGYGSDLFKISGSPTQDSASKFRLLMTKNKKITGKKFKCFRYFLDLQEKL